MTFDQYYKKVNLRDKAGKYKEVFFEIIQGKNIGLKGSFKTTAGYQKGRIFPSLDGNSFKVIDYKLI